jgi:hypothetical protein
VRITPPAYTGDAAYEGPVPKDGIAGLPGTKVELRATSNRPLSGGEIAIKSAAGDPQKIAMQPPAAGEAEATGHFEIRDSGKLEMHLTDTAGNRSRDSFTATVTRLTDERPFVRITQPRESSLATPTANLPIELAAEDDYGIARVQLFRSLNDSRPLPMDVRRPSKPPRRLGEKVFLPLAQYGVSPGDVIKVFARVEDTDPAGAKGTESPVVTVRIISQEEFERMIRVRQGMQVLLSKYNQARRRLETLAGEMDQERVRNAAEAKESPEADAAKSPLADKDRENLGKMYERLKKEADAIRKAAEHMLPYDLDENLVDELAKAAEDLEKMAEELEKLKGNPDATKAERDELLKKLADRLKNTRKDFDEAATQPLAHFAKIFPLIADMQRFIALAAHQRDLAERLAVYKGQDLVNDPTARGRLRDLEAEQRRVRDELDALLSDIENHAKGLPEVY